MIPRAWIDHWRSVAPWAAEHQVEQDLVISRALVAIYSDPDLCAKLAFRGGTALQKLHLPAARYSEDIDLVQTRAEPIGPVLVALRDRLDGWLGEPRRDFSEGRVTLTWRFRSEGEPALPPKLKVEINTREHFTAFGLQERPYEVRSPWFSGSATLTGYSLEELLGTKLRALYQRKKGRDLYDLWSVLSGADPDRERIVAAFRRYVEAEGHPVSRAQFEQNLAEKRADPRFLRDVEPLLRPGARWDPALAMEVVGQELVSRLPGEPWRGQR